ncbi:MAG: pyroglutamyl-peptidase I [Anaerolineales bacterium]|nr:pyroglutamyl-peptidase I [Anaerolineales bacterium]
MKLLLTGFEPFGGSTVNPSEQVAHTLNGHVIGGFEITSTILPVTRSEGPARLLEALENIQPDAVICLGEAPRRAAISIERIAVNLLDYRIPDNAGTQVQDEPIVPGGPAAYFVTLPVRVMLDAIRSAAVPAELSLSAGTYLCNQVLYTLLHNLAACQTDILAGFIHLPALPEQAVSDQRPSMALETMIKGITAAIEVIKKPSESLENPEG